MTHIRMYAVMVLKVLTCYSNALRDILYRQTKFLCIVWHSEAATKLFFTMSKIHMYVSVHGG